MHTYETQRKAFNVKKTCLVLHGVGEKESSYQEWGSKKNQKKAMLLQDVINCTKF